ncbi:hypothetical protein KUTeg_016139 [Tegillarca granosa]|uniref:Asparagine synthetase domain-containing protein n=1 Tax=Tegillarca granosa TaxID=220873 RepID=A0ABQ9EL35_TEGGR|nr:hypothetical protein KUTeg_016139 [Tegillarca granosa]
MAAPTKKDRISKLALENHNRLSRRGPDVSDKMQVTIHENKILNMIGHVLHLRGQVTPQPLSDPEGNVLLWNGEIFGGIELQRKHVVINLGNKSDITQVKEEENDTEILLKLLSQSSVASHIINTTSLIQGPWAFIYWQKMILNTYSDANNGSSKPGINEIEYLEVPSVGLYCVTFPRSCDTDNCKLDIHLYPWYRAVWPGTMDKVDVGSLNDRLYPGYSSSHVTFSLDLDQQVPSQIPVLNKKIPLSESVDRSKEKIDSQKYIQNLIQEDVNLNLLSDQLIHVLQMAVCKRVYNQPDLHQRHKTGASHNTALCSGNKEIEESLDMEVKGQQTPNSGESWPSDNINDSNCKFTSTVGNQNGKASNISPNSGHQKLEVLEDRMSSCTITEPDDVVKNNISVCNNYVYVTNLTRSEVNIERSAKVAILFSGGIDSAVITALVDSCDGQQRWNVPDRQTGYTALSELNPKRKWNFILVNVTLEELKKVRSDHVRHLVYPLDTVLDDSIGCAVWFAARGEGILGNGDHIGQPYKSRAKVILCGMGADEQFAGYARHRGKYQESGFQGLIDEIELEVSRISARNLGRDDRVITDHGKESRFPFLDENVVSFLSQLPIYHKANLDLPRGLGEKILLRMSATKLGLVKTANCDVHGHFDSQNCDVQGHYDLQNCDVHGHFDSQNYDVQGHYDLQNCDVNCDVQGHYDLQNCDVQGHYDLQNCDVQGDYDLQNRNVKGDYDLLNCDVQGHYELQICDVQGHYDLQN